MSEKVVLTVGLTFSEILAIIKGAKSCGDCRMFRTFIDDWYYKFTEEQRFYIFDYSVKEIYHKFFTADAALHGLDKLFLSRYNPDTQVEVEYLDEKDKRKKILAFVSEGQYYVSSYESIPRDFILKTEYI